MNDFRDKKVALVYDRVNKWGGAERVLLALHEMFPDAPLFTAVYNSQAALWASIFDIRTSWLQRIPFASNRHESLPFLMPLAFESFNFDNYDLVISITSEAAKGIIVRPPTKHICYCLTPTRYLWSGYSEYFKNPLLRIFSAPFVWYLKKWDRIAGQRPDQFIAISEEVQKRIKKYYGRDSVVVYPPVGLAPSASPPPRPSLLKDEGDAVGYFLVVSRLVPYKRVDLAIQACNDLGLPLKIVGMGSEFGKLKNMAGVSVEFVGNLTDEELVTYYRNCRALIFPGYEDFGLTIVEAQLCGNPVIAYKAGGAIETIIPGKTGLFFSPQTKEALKEALRTFDKKAFREEDFRKQGERFSKEEFKKKFIFELNSSLE